MSRPARSAAPVASPALSRPRVRPAHSKPEGSRPARRAGHYSLASIPMLPEADYDETRDRPLSHIALPFRAELEERFGRSLEQLVVLTGEPVADWLSQSDADAAAVGNVICLRDAAASIETVSHEVVHALQGEKAARRATASFETLDRDHPAEHEAAALTTKGSDSPVRETLAGNVVAFRRANIPSTPPPTKPSDEDTFARELDKTVASEEPATRVVEDEQTAGAPPPKAAGESPEPAALKVPPADVPAPTLVMPEPPETELSPEELAAREAELEAAKLAIAEADDIEGVVGAYADAPPTVKAATQSMLGGRIEEVIAADEQTFNENLPEFHAELIAGEAPEPTGTVAAPEATDVVLEAGVPPPAPEPDLPPLPPPKPYQENDQVVSFLRRFFGADAASAVARALGKVATADHGIDTSAGERPTVPQEDDTDPARVADQQQAAAELIKTKRQAATQLVIDGPGPDKVQLRAMDELVPVGELTPVESNALAGAPEAERLTQMALPEEVLAQFDQDLGATMQVSLEEARSQFGLAERDRDAQRDAAVTTAERERDRLTREADEQQRAEVLTGRESIQSLRQGTIDAQQLAVTQLEADAELARGETELAIETRAG